ncbi:MAG: pilus assembly protein PilP [Deltaproteobacteria bacterium]|nr:pilus assembly protein PilP [Deltaproteobacteria bacterium]
MNKKLRRLSRSVFWEAITIVFILMMAGSSYSMPDVVFKEARPEKDLTEKKEEAAYVYNPAGKTDPFVPFIVEVVERTKTTQEKAAKASSSEWQAKMESMLKEMKEPKTELQRIDIANLTLTSVIKGKDKIWAMVSDPDGRGYLIKKGTCIGTNGGIVEEIISEDRQTSFGTEAVRKITIKEPFFNQDRQLDYKKIEMKMPSEAQK